MNSSLNSSLNRAFSEISEHVWMLNQNAPAQNGEIISSKAYPKEWIDYINKTPAMKAIIANRNTSLLQQKYADKIAHISTQISQIAKTQQEAELAVLEYMRLMVTYDAISGTQKDSNGKFTNISHGSKESGLVPAFAGKGICQAQAIYTRDILLALGINARTLWLSSGTSHADVLIDEKRVMDPTNFDGSVNSIAGGHLYDKFGLNRYDGYRNLDPRKLAEIQQKVQTMLIKDLGIDTISRKLDVSNKTGYDKHLAIWLYLGSRLSPSNTSDNAYMVNINGNEIEMNSAMELFYKANNMHYTVLRTFSTDNCDRYIPLAEIDINGRKRGVILSHILQQNTRNPFNINALQLLSLNGNDSYVYDNNSSETTLMVDSLKRLVPKIDAINAREIE